MKKLIFILLCGLSVIGCKKSSTEQPKTATLTYSFNHADGMILSLSVTNENGKVLFSNSNLTADGSATLQVSPGDVLTASYNSNVVNEIENNDYADIKMQYTQSIVSEAQGGVKKSENNYSLVLDIPN